MTSMTKLFVPSMALVVSLAIAAGIAGPAAAQPAGDPAPAAAAPSPAPAEPAAAAGDARKQCTTAMNADPRFAAEIVRIADEAAAQKRDAETLAAHKDAEFHIQKNERHVIYAYAAMWIVAAGFVLFLWRRQRALTAEIAQLRRELDDAAGGKPGEARS